MKSPAQRYAVIFGVVALFAVSDLWSKRWIEDNLASDRHLLPAKAAGVTEGTSIGDVVRGRFPELTDENLAGRLFRVDLEANYEPDAHVFELGAGGPAIRGFYVFDDGNLDSFARRVHRMDAYAIQRWVTLSKPGIERADVAKLVDERLKGVTVRDFLATKLPHLSGEELEATAAKGTFGYTGSRGMVNPSDPAQDGALYLVSRRDIVLIPGYLEFDYVENPAGAWGILGGVSEDVRRAIFFGLSIVAILVVLVLIFRPPTDKAIPLIALGAILGGAIGNLVDRMTLTYVVDFVHMHWRDAVVDLPLFGPIRMDWPRYNIADIGITVGVAVLLLTTGFTKPESKQQSS